MPVQLPPKKFDVDLDDIWDWIQGLDLPKKAAVLLFLDDLVSRWGLNGLVEQGDAEALGKGLFELKVRREADVLAKKYGVPSAAEGEGLTFQLRMFGGSGGPTLILIVHAYDKGERTSRTAQQEEIQTAHKRLKARLMAGKV